jgi:subtilisin family serine protease
MLFTANRKFLPLFCALSLTLLKQTLLAAPADDETQILVRAKRSVNEQAFDATLAAHGGRRHQEIAQLKVRVVRVRRDRAEKLIDALTARPDVEFAEPDAVATAFGTTNDPFFASGQEWHLSTIQAPSAWDVTTGNQNVVIAVVDTGVAGNHPDLAGKILTGGYDFVSNDSDPNDDNGHGTSVAGAAAAASNNGVGVAGVSWGSTILPIKVLDSTGSGNHSAIANGIVYAADRGVRVINLSLGGTSGSQTLQDAVSYAWNKGAVVVAAAGNNGNNVPCYPAAYAQAVAVSATNSSDIRTSWSNYGAYVDIAAPGENIITTAAPDVYSSANGTSFSSPITSGVVALMAAANSQLTNTQLVDLLLRNADDIASPGVDVDSGYGRVNANRAVVAALSIVPSDVTTPTVTFNSPANGATLSGTTNIAITATDNIAATRVELYIDGQLEAQVEGASMTVAWDTGIDADGSHTLEARAYDGAGNVGNKTISVVVRNAVADMTKPVVAITSPSDGSRITSTYVTIRVTSSDNIGVTKVSLFLDGRLAATTTQASPSFTWNTYGIARGWHTLQAYAYDAVGNTGTSSTVRVYK